MPITVLTAATAVVGPIGIKLTSYNSSFVNKLYPAKTFAVETLSPDAPPLNVEVTFELKDTKVLFLDSVPQSVPIDG